MKKILYTLLTLFLSINVMGQCNYSNNRIINTGYNPSTNTTIANGSPDPFWELLNLPPIKVGVTPVPWSNYPDVALGTAYAIGRHSGQNAWCATSTISAKPISPRNTVSMGANNIYNNQPYKIARSFCLKSDEDILFDFCLAGDDAARVSLVDHSSGSTIFRFSTRYGLAGTMVGGSGQNFYTPWCLNQSYSLQTGTYTLLIELLNTNGNSMGVQLSGTLSTVNGSNFLSNANGCCETGDVGFLDIYDENCNGILDGDEVSLPGIEFDLLDNSGNVIATSTTDANGELFFYGVPFGQYTISEVGGGANALTSTITLDESTQNLYFTFYDCDTTYIPPPPPECCQTDLNISPSQTAITTKENTSANGLIANASLMVGQNSGIPISEVNVTVADVNYTIDNSSCHCVPNFALPLSISSSNTIGSGTNVLSVGTGANINQEITWSNDLGAVINAENTIDFDFNLPPQASIPCCMTGANVCVKVSWKDANCNVCDTVLCFTVDLMPEPEPCEITIGRLSNFYKCGSSMNITWNAANTLGDLTIYVADYNGNLQEIEQGVNPSTGMYTWPIPSNNSMFPCGEDLTIVIESEYYGEKCRTESTIFQLECCDKCECGKWSTTTANYLVFYKFSSPNSPKPADPRKKSNIIKPTLGKPVDCKGKIEIGKGGELRLAFPEFICEPSKECNASYSWEIHDENRTVVASGVTRNVRYQFYEAGQYGIIITPKCGSEECKPCVVYVFVKGDDTDIGDHKDCKCGKYIKNQIRVSSRTGSRPLTSFISCGQERTMRLGAIPSIQFTAPAYQCPKGCNVKYKWEVLKSGVLVDEETGLLYNHVFNGLGARYEEYEVRCTPICGDKECDPCIIKLKLRRE